MAKKVTDRLMQRMSWLDGVAGVMKRAWEPVAGDSAPRALKDALVGTWLGHPLHPAVVLMPIGFWTSSFVLDLAGEEDAADLLLALGLASTAPAMATGAAQWMDATTDDNPRRLGALHAAVNTLGAGLYAASLIARRNDHRGRGVALSTAGLALVNLGGLLGGDLAYDRGIGVDHSAFESPPDTWTEVLDESDLEAGKPKRVEVDGTAVMLLKHEDGIHEIGAVCPHLGGPLDEGEIDGETVSCPWHGSVYCLKSGDLLHGPATAPVESYDVRVQQGRIAIRVQA
ncbi:MAG: Rieske 2Fe-2S domain-containing protein [Thermomicrobiales bacterium]|nr:Rieske 2Fe-2S domain-containing protein [Thermomicrobiales bacterium]